MSAARRQVSIRFTTVSIFVLAAVLTAIVAIGLQQYFSQRQAIDDAVERYRLTADNVGQFYFRLDREAADATRQVANFASLSHGGVSRIDARDVFTGVMGSNPVYYSMYLGFDDGSFFEIVNLNASDAARELFDASLEDRWVAISMDAGDERVSRELTFLDERLKTRAMRTEPASYDPRTRPWFEDARKGRVRKTEPYLFDKLQAPGQTYSIRLPAAPAVLGVDVALASVSEYLRANATTEDGSVTGEIFLFRDNGEIIASTDAGASAGKPLPDSTPLALTAQQQAWITDTGTINVSNGRDWAPIDFTVAGIPSGYSIDLVKLLAGMTGLDINFHNSLDWTEMIEGLAAGRIDLLHSVFHTADNAGRGLYSEPYLDLPYSLAFLPGRTPVAHARELEGQRLAMPRGWSLIPVLQEQFPDIRIEQYASTLDCLRAVRDGHADYALDSGLVLRYTAAKYFVEGLAFHDAIAFDPATAPTGLSLLVSPGQPVLAGILDAALANVRPEQWQAMAARWLAPDSAPGLGVVPYPELLAMAGDPSRHRQLLPMSDTDDAHFAYVGRSQSLESGTEYIGVVVPRDTLLGPALAQVRNSALVTVLVMALLLPVSWFFANPIIRPIDALVAENRKVQRREWAQVQTVATGISEYRQLTDSMVDMAGSIKQHEEDLAELLESFIRIIAQAIDDKSPYTAGHCNRVPELGVMLAEAASTSKDAPFDSFHFDNEDERREFRIAAWLHDCGKITTPEYIVDKGSKLETKYNRIHEIRTRFEVLRRDAQIDYLQGLLDTPGNEAELKAQLEARLAQLEDDFAFIARTNVGGESMADEDLERLSAIARTPWTRHYDDRLGLSPAEELELETPAASLPAQETLLVDRPEHIVRRQKPLEFDPRHGIDMIVPEHLYNLGELYNLSVRRGTLTTEDRFKINEHMISTIKMLGNLPFPQELANVPRYASTHHETLRGDGYPRRLPGEALSIPERILAVADVYEALTASDRPYKTGKPVSEAVAILHRMAQDNHLDMDVVQLFLRSGVYRDYGERYLGPGQRDEVRLEAYLAG